MAVKIKSYNIRNIGRSKAISLPASWVDGLTLPAKVDVYQDDAGRLILCPPGVTPNTDLSSGEAREMRGAL